jgi:cyclomaltodextrinase / maltogenic alpha-amylase / neopullulanase
MKPDRLFHATLVLCAIASIFISGLAAAEPGKGSLVPEWSKRVIWYEIIPARFRMGDPGDPSRTGGDIQGIIDELDYLKGIGIGAIYFNPLFTSISVHKYDASCYHHIDPDFGPDPVGDRRLIEKERQDDPKTWVWTKADLLALEMIEEIHARGLKLIFDAPFNHLGIESFAFKDVREKRKKSRFEDWFTITQWGDEAAGKPLEWKGFLDETIYAELRKDSKAANKYICASTERWMKPVVDGKARQGIDGWRLDLADFIPHEFWRHWCAFARRLNREAFLMGELAKPFSDPRRYLNEGEFCSMMNYPFALQAGKFFIGRSIGADRFALALSSMRNHEYPDIDSAMYNLMDSHDTERLASWIVNPLARKTGDARDFTNADLSEGNPSFDGSSPNAAQYRTLKLIALFQMTYIGAPALLYGEELGLSGGVRNYISMPWKDRGDAINEDVLAYYRKAMGIRNTNIELQLGDCEILLADKGSGILAYSRTYGNGSIVVILNNGTADAGAELPLKDRYRDIMGGKGEYAPINGKIKVKIPEYSGLVLKKI